MNLAGLILQVVAVIVVLAFATIGFLYVTRGSPMRKVRPIGTSDAPVSPAEPESPLQERGRTHITASQALGATTINATE